MDVGVAVRVAVALEVAVTEAVALLEAVAVAVALLDAVGDEEPVHVPVSLLLALDVPLPLGDAVPVAEADAVPLPLALGVPVRVVEDDGDGVPDVDDEALRIVAMLRPRRVMDDTATPASPDSHSDERSTADVTRMFGASSVTLPSRKQAARGSCSAVVASQV